MIAVAMSGPRRYADDHFRPLRPATGRRLLAAIIFGPFAWVVVFLVISWIVDATDAIEVGLLIAFGSFLVGLAVLPVLRAGRERERRRYAERS
jgi:MFS superfamily sulfate permease-like transporter